jgi:hypothetical protein
MTAKIQRADRLPTQFIGINSGLSGRKTKRVRPKERGKEEAGSSFFQRRRAAAIRALSAKTTTVLGMTIKVKRKSEKEKTRPT